MTGNRLSASCFACKARNVKCDLRKPSCNRCISLGRACPGYSDPWAVVHRQQNVSAAHQVQTRVAKRLKERGGLGSPASIGDIDDEETSPDVLEEETMGRRPIAVPKAFQVDSELASMNHFSSNYASGGEIALFNLFSDMKSSAATSPVLQEALKATALASSSLQMCQAGLMAQARQHYSKAITKISTALKDNSTAQDDSVVTALLTLGIFEAIVPDTSPRKIRSHCRGSLALLRYRAEHGVATSLDKGLLAFVVHLGMLEIFIGQEGRSPVLVGLKNAPWAKGGMVEPLLVRAIDYKFMAQQVLSSPDAHRASAGHVSKVFQMGIDIIRDLESAANYRILSPAPRNKPGPDGSVDEEMNSFNHLLGRKSIASDAIAKGLYLTIRLHLIEYILSLSIALGEPTGEELRTLANLPHGLTAVEQVCEQVRIVFGFDGRESACTLQGVGFNAWYMFWPMIAVLKSAFADKDTKMWIMDKCMAVSQASGFGMAMYQQGWFETVRTRDN
ncbi:hypothetical protein CORC01_03739 [Colletotrichum orchidophilum]|uniref:Zn(2)-C6 fungal-type domain-containing protein n=1 Tax=Colletotrichum orchidophilum TaxID=1209926 RepID=A0A1G4BHN6_9PEZI|nr:uncharacterized protein CORC01_03739 [Colletotrichum orchidophilum]OHF00911.1 hypothetical protein CORC01_03739 [Colletotrichum orchidophilum]